MTVKKQAYHHGDLRRALTDAALMVLKDDGLGKISLRSIARRAGVSQAAPYSHFPDKTALLVEVAADGFSAFRAALKAIPLTGKTRAEEADYLNKLGIAYVRFALENKSLFQLMFGDALSEIPKSERYIREGDAAYSLIRTAVSRLTSDETAPLAAWSAVHGLATLMVDGKISAAPDLEGQVRDMLKFYTFTHVRP